MADTDYMIAYLREFEAEKRGRSEELWKQHACLCDRATDDAIAAEITTYAKVNGRNIVITWHAWRDHRQDLRLIRRHPVRRVNPSNHMGQSSEPAAPLFEVTEIALLVEAITNLRVSVDRLTNTMAGNWVLPQGVRGSDDGIPVSHNLTHP